MTPTEGAQPNKRLVLMAASGPSIYADSRGPSSVPKGSSTF